MLEHWLIELIGHVSGLSDAPPKLDKAHLTAERIIAAGHRASQILDDMRELFGTDERAQDPVDVNALTLTVLRGFVSPLCAELRFAVTPAS